MTHTVGENLKRTGYDLEEEYFYRLNRQLLDDLRSRRSQAKSHEVWWMRCPHCGAALSEQSLNGLKADCCTGCGGVFLDRAELAHFAVTNDAEPFKQKIKDLLRAAFKPLPSGIGQFPV